jgi:hypothetical protein
MKQGRQSRCVSVRAFTCALVAMLAIAVVVPAVASAQGANEEYGQASLPSGGNGDTNPSNVTPAAGDSSDSGGTSVLLVGLAAVAAVCAGFAAWRLRGGGGDDDDDRGPQQRVAPSAGSSETP